MGFLPVGRVVVMDSSGAPRLAWLDELTEWKTGQTPAKGSAAELGGKEKVVASSMANELIDVRKDRSTLCRCGRPRRPGQKNCLKCHREKQSGYRQGEREAMLRLCRPIRGQA